MGGVREATSTDVPDLVRLGQMALRADPAPKARISTQKLQDLARACVGDTNNYSWVSEIDGEVVAGLCALVHEQLVYERKQASVVQFYTTRPGEGIKLIRHFLKWARAQRKIKCIVFSIETNADPRIQVLLRRLGMKYSVPMCVEWK